MKERLRAFVKRQQRLNYSLWFSSGTWKQRGITLDKRTYVFGYSKRAANIPILGQSNWPRYDGGHEIRLYVLGRTLTFAVGE